jgi:hypothetical protein
MVWGSEAFVGLPVNLNLALFFSTTHVLYDSISPFPFPSFLFFLLFQVSTSFSLSLTALSDASLAHATGGLGFLEVALVT